MNDAHEYVLGHVADYLSIAREIAEDLDNADSCETGSDLIANLQSALDNANQLAAELTGAIAIANGKAKP
jgi:hypothetical protein